MDDGATAHQSPLASGAALVPSLVVLFGAR